MEVDAKILADLDQKQAADDEFYARTVEFVKDYLREFGTGVGSSPDFFAYVMETYLDREQLAMTAAHFLLKEAKRQLDEENGHVLPTL